MVTEAKPQPDFHINHAPTTPLPCLNHTPTTPQPHLNHTSTTSQPRDNHHTDDPSNTHKSAPSLPKREHTDIWTPHVITVPQKQFPNICTFFGTRTLSPCTLNPLSGYQGMAWLSGSKSEACDQVAVEVVPLSMPVHINISHDHPCHVPPVWHIRARV